MIFVVFIIIVTTTSMASCQSLTERDEDPHDFFSSLGSSIGENASEIYRYNFDDDNSSPTLLRNYFGEASGDLTYHYHFHEYIDEDPYTTHYKPRPTRKRRPKPTRKPCSSLGSGCNKRQSCCLSYKKGNSKKRYPLECRDNTCQTCLSLRADCESNRQCCTVLRFSGGDNYPLECRNKECLICRRLGASCAEDGHPLVQPCCSQYKCSNSICVMK